MQRVRLLLMASGLLLLGLSTYYLFSYFNVLANDGKVTITTSQKSMVSYIYSANSEYQKLGTGSVVFSIKPGNYTLLFDYKNNLQYKNITVRKGGGQNFSVLIPDNNIKSENTNKLIKLLPYYGPGLEYSVTYTYNFSTGVATPLVTISYTSAQSLNDALLWLKQIGVSPNQVNLKTTQVPSVQIN